MLQKKIGKSSPPLCNVEIENGTILEKIYQSCPDLLLLVCSFENIEIGKLLLQMAKEKNFEAMKMVLVPAKCTIDSTSLCQLMEELPSDMFQLVVQSGASKLADNLMQIVDKCDAIPKLYQLAIEKCAALHFGM